MVLASRRWPRLQLRGVQSPPSDPVSFALLAGSDVASYPRLPGWSPTDTAARAVAEHRAWLAHPREAEGGEALGMLISAARAALFAEALAAGDAVLTPTVAATLRALRARTVASVGVIDDVEEAYLRWRGGGRAPGERVVEAAGALVARLGPYRRD
jgi:hypothetical protein